MIEPKVVALIDYYTGVFSDCSVLDVFDYLQLSDLLTDDLNSLYCDGVFRGGLDSGYEVIVSSIKVRWKSTDVQLIQYQKFLMDEELNGDVFYWKLPYIRVEMSGATLSHLRSLGYNIDAILLKPDLVPEGVGYHPTRFDFAFDFINYKPDFLDSCIEQIDRSALPSGYLMSKNRGGMSYELHTGATLKCLYLGSSHSPSFCRIYDKGLQYEYSRKVNPYAVAGEIPSSWIRIEWECKKRFAEAALSSMQGNKMAALRYIFERFALWESDGTESGRERHVSECWLDLFDWATIPHIIQNADCGQYLDPVARAVKWIKEGMLGNLILFEANYGKQALLDLVDNEWHHLQVSNVMADRRRVHGIKSRMMQSTGTLPDYIYKNQHGVLELR